MSSVISFLKENVLREEKLISELILFSNLYKKAGSQERNFLEKSSASLLNQIKIVHNSTGSLINELELKNKLLKVPQNLNKDYVRVNTSQGDVLVKKVDKKRFLEELKIKKVSFGAERAIDNLEMNKPSGLVIVSSRLFKGISKPLSEKIKFLDKDLKQADMPYIVSSYLSLIFFLTFIALIFCLVVVLVVSINSSGFSILRNLMIALILIGIFFIFLLYYPKLQVKNNAKKLENEMPFALAHMSAIASSRIEPSKVFLIMSNSRDYKLFSIQMKKIVNQVNIYGYDLTTALKNVARLSSSRKFSEFLNGFTSIISSGGDLMTYIKEKSKDTLLDYKLSRERYSTTIGMYSDIYTALLIAAPLILMLILSFMSSLGSTIGSMSISSLATIGIVAIVALNILFILFLSLTQPEG